MRDRKTTASTYRVTGWRNNHFYLNYPVPMTSSINTIIPKNLGFMGINVALPFSVPVALGNLSNLSRPQFPLQGSWEN